MVTVAQHGGLPTTKIWRQHMGSVRKAPAKYIDPLDPIPVGEVQETDWAEWEDSVAFQDSVMGVLPEELQPSQPAESNELLDIFSSVKRTDA
jgi:hypothetical protein